MKSKEEKQVYSWLLGLIFLALALIGYGIWNQTSIPKHLAAQTSSHIIIEQYNLGLLALKNMNEYLADTITLEEYLSQANQLSEQISKIPEQSSTLTFETMIYTDTINFSIYAFSQVAHITSTEKDIESLTRIRNSFAELLEKMH